MKLLYRNRGNGGSALAVVMVLTPIFVGVAVAGLMMANQTHRESARSQAWNTSLPAAEAGIEEALTHLNIHGATNLANDGWTAVSGTTMYYLQRDVGDQTYLAVISNHVAGASANKPSVECRGYARMGGSGGVLARGIRVTTEQRSAMRGFVTRGQLELQDVIVDSYDSTDPLYSSNGTYVASMAKDNGFLGSNSRSSGAVNIHQGTKIVGYVGTGASGVLHVENPTTVGDAAWVASGANSGKVQTNHLATDLNVPFPVVSAPFSGGYFTPGSGTLGGTNYTYLLGGDNYQISGTLNLSGSDTLLVTGNATLYVTGSVLVSGNSKIMIAPGAKLNLYVKGTAFNASGNAQVNAYGTPSQLAYFGLPTNVDFKGSGSPVLVGTFYAPKTHADLVNNVFIAGAAMFDVLEAQHHVSFHYDEALAKNQDRLFIVTSWNEMQPSAVNTLPSGIAVRTASY